MTLKQWLNNGWLRSHKTSTEEIGNLLAIVERDIKDASEGEISADWSFGIAYNAALKLCTILLYSEGYKAERNLQHYRTIQALSMILGSERKNDVDFLESCRAKRNIVEYDYIGAVTTDNAQELIEFVKDLKVDVERWLAKNHPDYLGSL
jgi:hypothetical protein